MNATASSTMNGKLALLCDIDEPCHISSEDSMFPYPNLFCHPPFPRGGCTQRYDSAIVVLGDMEVFMINVVIGPHANTAIVGTGQNPVGGLLTANGVFTGVNVTLQGGGALYGAGVSVGKRFACGGCRGFCGFLDNVATDFPNPGWHGGAIVNPNMHGVLVLRDPLFANNTPLSSRIAPPHGMYRATPTVGR